MRNQSKWGEIDIILKEWRYGSESNITGKYKVKCRANTKKTQMQAFHNPPRRKQKWCMNMTHSKEFYSKT